MEMVFDDFLLVNLILLVLFYFAHIYIDNRCEQKWGESNVEFHGISPLSYVAPPIGNRWAWYGMHNQAL